MDEPSIMRSVGIFLFSDMFLLVFTVYWGILCPFVPWHTLYILFFIRGILQRLFMGYLWIKAAESTIIDTETKNAENGVIIYAKDRLVCRRTDAENDQQTDG
jgi:hypothetical protein